jgi:tetratricopeptide (TPR) repeat protein
VNVLRLVTVLTLVSAGTAGAQLAVPQTQNLEKLLILPIPVANAKDSAASVAAMDAARDRLHQLARYKVYVIPKSKICEALEQSGFPCDGLMSEQQSGQLARALGINSYTTGELRSRQDTLIADIHVHAGGSGFAAAFTINGATSPQALGESIAQRLNSIVRAGEYARNCNDQRSRNSLDRAMSEAKKAFEIEPNLAAANLCMATVIEVGHGPVDSIIDYARRALRGDPGNPEAWNTIATKMMVKGDSAGALDAYDSLLSYNPTDNRLRMGLVQLLLQAKQYERAEKLVRVGLSLNPADQQLKDLLKRTCVEGALYGCTLEILKDEVTADTAKLSDTTELKAALANATAASDTQALLWWSHQAVDHFPTSAVFLKQLGGAFQLAGQMDSAVIEYQRALALTPGDVATSILIAKTVVDAAVWDTARASTLRATKDTATLRKLQQAFGAHLDSVRPYLAPGYASPDSAFQLTTAVVGLSGGSKLAQAGAYESAYQWLDQLLTQLAPRSAADTTGPRQQIRVQGSFWFGLSSALSLGKPYGQMVKDKSCDQAKAVNDRIQRSRQALSLGGRVAPQVATQMLGILGQYEAQMPKVKAAFKCRNF